MPLELRSMGTEVLLCYGRASCKAKLTLLHPPSSASHTWQLHELLKSSSCTTCKLELGQQLSIRLSPRDKKKLGRMGAEKGRKLV